MIFVFLFDVVVSLDFIYVDGLVFGNGFDCSFCKSECF